MNLSSHPSELLRKTDKILAGLEDHFNSGCDHCRRLLQEILEVD